MKFCLDILLICIAIFVLAVPLIRLQLGKDLTRLRLLEQPVERILYDSPPNMTVDSILAAFNSDTLAFNASDVSLPESVACLDLDDMIRGKTWAEVVELLVEKVSTCPLSVVDVLTRPPGRNPLPPDDRYRLFKKLHKPGGSEEERRRLLRLFLPYDERMVRDLCHVLRQANSDQLFYQIAIYLYAEVHPSSVETLLGLNALLTEALKLDYAKWEYSESRFKYNQDVINGVEAIMERRGQHPVVQALHRIGLPLVQLPIEVQEEIAYFRAANALRYAPDEEFLNASTNIYRTFALARNVIPQNDSSAHPFRSEFNMAGASSLTMTRYTKLRKDEDVWLRVIETAKIVMEEAACFETLFAQTSPDAYVHLQNIVSILAQASQGDYGFLSEATECHQKRATNYSSKISLTRYWGQFLKVFYGEAPL